MVRRRRCLAEPREDGFEFYNQLFRNGLPWQAEETQCVSRGDPMCEVVVSDDRDLLDLTNRIRAVDGVRSTETFIYLDLVKQTFTWGAH